MKPAISVCHFCRFNRKSTPGRLLGEIYLKEMKYNLFQSCCLKKTTASNPLSLMTFKNEIHAQEQCKPYANHTPSPRQAQCWKPPGPEGGKGLVRKSDAVQPKYGQAALTLKSHGSYFIY